MKRLLLIIFVGLCAWYVKAQAATTGNTGATAFSISAVWTNGDSALAASGSDNERAEHTGSTDPNTLILKTFGFSITAGSTIDAITVNVEGHGTANPAAERRLDGQLTKNGSSGVGDKPYASLPKNTDGTVEYAPATDVLWGTTWSVSEIESANFGIILSPNGGTFTPIRVDYLTIDITYTEGSGLSGRRRRMMQRSSPGGEPITEFIGYVE